MNDILNKVTALAQQAGERIRSAYFQPVEVTHKGSDTRNEVTGVDREVGTWLERELRAQFPDYGVYSEENEGSTSELEKDHVFTIDPIDGTSNFARRIPLFSTVISLLVRGVPTLTVVHNPITGETFSFATGEGVFRDGERVTASVITDPKKASAIVRPGRNEQYHPWIFAMLLGFTKGNVAKISNFGASAYDLSLLASGSIDTVIYGTMSTADIAGTIGMVREVGGEVYTPLGVPVTITPTPQPIIAVANKDLFEQLKPFLALELYVP